MDVLIIRLIQLTRWTWEIAEEFVKTKPQKAKRFIDAVKVQQAADPKGEWFS